MTPLATVCQRSSDPFNILTYYIEWGHYFLDIQYYALLSLSAIRFKIQSCYYEPLSPFVTVLSYVYDQYDATSYGMSMKYFAPFYILTYYIEWGHYFLDMQ